MRSPEYLLEAADLSESNKILELHEMICEDLKQAIILLTNLLMESAVQNQFIFRVDEHVMKRKMLEHRESLEEYICVDHIKRVLKYETLSVIFGARDMSEYKYYRELSEYFKHLLSLIP